jgi:carbamoyltransferase
MKDALNTRVKHRETFRPFAPSVLNEHSGSWFGLSDSPFTLRVARVLRPGVPAKPHCDQTARIQTVTAEDNPIYYAMIRAFHERTGIPMVLNTSFTVRGDPIVESPEDALECFLSTDLDHVIFPGWIVSKV